MQNLKENIEKLNNYLSDTSYNDIDIVDLIKYLSSKFGVKQEIQKEKYQRLEEYIGDSKKVLLVLVDGLGYYKVNELSDSSILKKNFSPISKGFQFFRVPMRKIARWSSTFAR